MAADRCRVRVVVLDGLDWEWTSAHPEHTPALQRVAERGCRAPLRACTAPITPTGVAALLAGREVDLDWVRRRGVMGDFYATSHDLIRSRPWAPELARHGMTVGLVNVPITWPAFQLAGVGYLTSGFPVDPVALTDESRPWYRPAGLDVVGYPIGTIVDDHGDGGTRQLERLVGAERDIATWLVTRAPRADVEVVWFRSTDGAGHHCWGTQRYADIVRACSDLVDVLADGCDNLVVISDHGFDALDSPRCDSYHATNHGGAATAAGLSGGHADVGVLFAAGDDIRSRGLLPEQRLVEVAGGLFDLLQVPPAPGMVSAGPDWASPLGVDEREMVRQRLRALGYVP